MEDWLNSTQSDVEFAEGLVVHATERALKSTYMGLTN